MNWEKKYKYGLIKRGKFNVQRSFRKLITPECYKIDLLISEEYKRYSNENRMRKLRLVFQISTLVLNDVFFFFKFLIALFNAGNFPM